MAHYLESEHDGVEITYAGWSNLVLLAVRFGWDTNGIEEREPHEDGCSSTDDTGCEDLDKPEQSDNDDGDLQSEVYIAADNAI